VTACTFTTPLRFKFDTVSDHVDSRHPLTSTRFGTTVCLRRPMRRSTGPSGRDPDRHSLSWCCDKPLLARALVRRRQALRTCEFLGVVRRLHQSMLSCSEHLFDVCVHFDKTNLGLHHWSGARGATNGKRLVRRPGRAGQRAAHSRVSVPVCRAASPGVSVTRAVNLYCRAHLPLQGGLEPQPGVTKGCYASGNACCRCARAHRLCALWLCIGRRDCGIKLF